MIAENEEVIVDCHTDRGKSRLRAQAEASLQEYEELAMREFLTVGAQLVPHVEVNGNPWGHEVREIYGLPYTVADSNDPAPADKKP